MVFIRRVSLPVPGAIQDIPNWETGMTLAPTVWTWRMLHHHLMQMYVFLPPLQLLALLLLQ